MLSPTSRVQVPSTSRAASSSRRRKPRAILLLLALSVLAASPDPAAAQRRGGIGRPRAPRGAGRGRRRGCRCETQLDVHGAFATGTTSHLNAWGGGLGVRSTFGRVPDPVRVVVAPGVDFVRQNKTGAGQTSAAVDLDLEAGGWHAFTPYAGVSAGGNWSSAGQWAGGRLGLGTQAGGLLWLGDTRLRLKAEERFGYVDGQEHMLTTRVGLLFSF